MDTGHPMVYTTLVLTPSSQPEGHVYRPRDPEGAPSEAYWLTIAVPCTGCSVAVCGSHAQIAYVVAQLSAALDALPAEVPA